MEIKKGTMINVNLPVLVTKECIDDIMSCVMESGAISYWCDYAEVVGERLGEYTFEQIARGGKLLIHLTDPFDEEDTETYELTKEKFLEGLRMYLEDTNKPYEILEPGTVRGYEIDTGNADAVVCDMIIQYALFGEIVFG